GTSPDTDEVEVARHGNVQLGPQGEGTDARHLSKIDLQDQDQEEHHDVGGENTSDVVDDDGALLHLSGAGAQQEEEQKQRLHDHTSDQDKSSAVDEDDNEEKSIRSDEEDSDCDPTQIDVDPADDRNIQESDIKDEDAELVSDQEVGGSSSVGRDGATTDKEEDTRGIYLSGADHNENET
ncbi:unnamed protein product, partial [Amoebophrya sp. A120]